MKPTHTLSRRRFLQATGTAALGMAALTAKNHAQAPGANGRLNGAIIGCGGMASGHLKALMDMRQQENIGILAVCDVYDTRARGFQDRLKAAGIDAKMTRRYQEVLAIKDLDYVTIATPEHAHAYITLAALEAGKHVYVEKPMTHTIEQAQAVLAKVKKTGLKLQVGVQGMSDDSYSSAYEAIKAGKIGPVVQAQIDYVRRYAAESGLFREKIDRQMPQPPDLDWETWLVPAPKRPWSAERYFEWRNYRDYSGGIATDLFIHRLCRILKAVGLTCPSRVTGMGGIYMWPDGRELPDNFEMLLEYPKSEGVTPGMTVHILGTMANSYANEHVIRGNNGTLVFNDQGWKIVEEQTGKRNVIETYKKKSGEDIVPHHRNHHAAIRGQAELNCPAELGLHAVVAMVMGNDSWQRRKIMAWDPQKQEMQPL